MGVGYGLIPSGVYRMAPGLNRFQQGGSPLAALIGNALGTYESQHQQQQEDLLQAQREQDAAQGRKTDIGLRLLGAGYAPGAAQPTGTVNVPGVGTIPDFANTPETYNISGVGPVHRIPTDKDTLAANATAATRAERVRIGHALATQTLGHDVSDDEAEGWGGAPSAMIAANKPEPKGSFFHGPSGEVMYGEPGGKVTDTGKNVGQSQSMGGQGGVMAQETRAAARNALAALDQADAALKDDPNADIYPTGAAIAEGAGNVPVVGGLLKGAMGPLGQAQLRPSQQKYQQAMDQFLHNYSALLPKGGRSVSILQNLRNSFTPRAGQESADVRGGFARARAGLRQQLEALAAGNDPGLLPQGEMVVPPPAAGSPAPVSTQVTPVSPAPVGAPIHWKKWQ